MSGRDLFETWAALPVRTGMLVALSADGTGAYVTDARQPGACAQLARSVVDLQGEHVGRQVVLLLEECDPSRPIILGVLREGQERPAQLAVETDGERMVVSARQQLVLRCGKASITLTRAGKVLIEGAYVSSRSSGVNRIKGGSVQVN